MTIKECIDNVDNIKPNQYKTEIKVQWLSFIDEIIINDVLKTHEGYDGRYDDFTGYSEDKLSTPLIVPSPYDRLYPAYLKMRIDGENGETARYNNSAALFNSYMMEYRKYYNKTHLPLSTPHKMPHPPNPNSLSVTDAQLEYLKRELYYVLSDDVGKALSDDKLYSIVTNYVSNNAQMLKGKDGIDGRDGIDGYTPQKNVDYFDGKDGEKGDKGDSYILTEEDKSEIATLVPTHEKYFQIENLTENGGCIISLKPVYRGAASKQVTINDPIIPANRIPCAESNNGVGKVGDKNYELPSDIYIPLTVNGITVTGLATGIFAYNDRIKRVVLQPNITDLQGYSFTKAVNLEVVECIEQITTIKQYEFAFTRVKKIDLPNLISTGSYAFGVCPLLEYVNIGSVTQIKSYTFYSDNNLREIKVIAPVTEVGKQAFWRCFNLRTIDNIVEKNKTTKIGEGAFFLCKPTYDWDSLGLPDEAYGNHATSNQTHTNKFWLQEDGTPIPFTPCENKPIPFIAQDDIRWQTTVVNAETGDTFYKSCEGMDVMGVWCALNNAYVEDARDYLDICLRYGVAFKDINYGIYDTTGNPNSTINKFYNAIGLKPYGYAASSWGKVEQARTILQAIYQSLADGKYVVFVVPNNLNDGGGHVVVARGVTATGELIIDETCNDGWYIGMRGSVTGRIPIQNLINTVKKVSGYQGVILSKKAVT